MLKYFLPAWKKALDEKISEEFKKAEQEHKKYEEEGKQLIIQVDRTVNYHVFRWLDSQFELGDMVPEF